mgnify:CR=1 FL=1
MNNFVKIDDGRGSVQLVHIDGLYVDTYNMGRIYYVQHPGTSEKDYIDVPDEEWQRIWDLLESRIYVP